MRYQVLHTFTMSAELGYTDMGFEGAGPWAYRKLSGTELTKELTRLANAQSIHGADVVCKLSLHQLSLECLYISSALQPCTISRSQDRFIVSQLDVPGGQWRFNGVFDGELSYNVIRRGFVD